MANESENVVPVPPKLDLTARLKKFSTPPSPSQTETNAPISAMEKNVAQTPSADHIAAQEDKTSLSIAGISGAHPQESQNQTLQPKPLIQTISAPTKAISIPKPPSQVSTTPKISIMPKVSEAIPQTQPPIPQTTTKPLVSQQPSSVPAGGATIKLQRPPSPAPIVPPTQIKPIAQQAMQEVAAMSQTNHANAANANMHMPGTTDTRPPSKRETSKIPLELAAAMNPGAVGTAPKTIKIKPSIQPSVSAPMQNVVKPAVNPEISTAPTSAEKRKTSRISLEAALALGTAVPKQGEETPKTIKLKKPGESPAIKLATAPVVNAQEAPTISVDAKSKTAKLEELTPLPEEAESPTRRKTIKVKRAPGTAPVTPILANAESSASELSQASDGTQLQMATAEDEPHWSFALIGVLGIIITVVLIWILVAQAFGPDICLTKLSYGAPNLDLPWPGKIISSR